MGIIGVEAALLSLAKVFFLGLEAHGIYHRSFP